MTKLDCRIDYGCKKKLKKDIKICHSIYLGDVMAKYLLLMYGKEMKMPKKVTKEMAEAGMKPWRDYLKPLIKKGSFGAAAPVAWKGKMMTSGRTQDYKPRNIDLVGYMVISAGNMPEALRIAKKSPHAKMAGTTTTVREIMEVPL